jgi:hypothetical protein
MKVYWAVSNYTQGATISRSLYLPPEPLTVTRVLTDIDTDSQKNNFRICPSFKDHLKNTYALRFPIDVDLEFNEMGLSSTLDQRILNDFVFVRNFTSTQKFMGFSIRYIFFAETPLKMSLTHPYMSDNQFSKETRVVPGEFDIGRWFRNTDLAFLMTQSKLSVKRGDDFSYIKFLTDEPIELVRFEFTPELNRIQGDLLASKASLLGRSPKLSYYYEIFKNSSYRSRILKEIKTNILE